MTMYAVGNVCNNPRMSQRQVVHDLAALAGLRADVTGAVEIMPSRYKRAFRETFEAAGAQVYNLSGEAPIATALPVRRSVVRRLHAGVARITPARVNSIIRLAGGPPVLVLCKHPVSGSTRTGRRAARTLGMAIRRRLFALDVKLTARRVRIAHRHGTNVVILGDLNTITAPAYAAGQVVASHRGLMWIIAAPAPAYVADLGRASQVTTDQLYTDHPFISREITFTRKGAR